MHKYVNCNITYYNQSNKQFNHLRIGDSQPLIFYLWDNVQAIMLGGEKQDKN